MGSDTPVELRFSPILKMVGVTIAVALIMVFINSFIGSFPGYETMLRDSSWLLAALLHIPQFVIPFLIIWYLSQGNLGEYGFNRKEKPPVFTHKRMLGLGVLFGLLMSLQYVIQFISGRPIGIPQPVTLTSMLGNLTFQWVMVGACEETMFRGLIQSYLQKNQNGFIEILGHSLHVGTVIGAVIWGAFHFINILVMPIGPVVFFVVLTTIAGLALGYAYQETGSLLTTIIVHNTIFGVPLAIGYFLYWI